MQGGAWAGDNDMTNHYFTGGIYLYNLPISKFDLDMSKCDLTTLSLRNCSNLVGSYDVSSMSNLTSINVEVTDIGFVIPPKDVEGLAYNIGGSLCASNGIVDLSSVKSISSFEIRNTDASVIYWPYDSSSRGISQFRVDGCELNGTLDLRVFESISNDINVYGNSRLTELILPDASADYIYGGELLMYNCNLQGNLDLSKQRCQRNFNVSGNTNLMSLDMPEVITNYNYHLTGRFHDCSLNQTTIDTILSDYAYVFSTITVAYNFTLSLEGGTNMPPTDGSMNMDISTLEYEFSQAGKTLTLTYNT